MSAGPAFMPSLLALGAALTWIGLLSARGGFWRLREWLPDAPTAQAWPAVTAVVPARDEAETIQATVRSICKQAYSGSLELIVVDDASRDATATLARAAADSGDRGVPVTVISGAPLPPGWTGKVWALAQAERLLAERAVSPDYLWLCDGDVVHARGVLSQLVAKAQRDACDLVSLMVCLTAGGLWGRLLVPAFVAFFRKLYPFAWVNDPMCRTAAAAGGSVLLRWHALRAAGGFAAIRGEIIDDCALARRIKDSGPHRRIWLGMTRSAHSLRPYAGIGDIWRMVARSAYAQLGYRPVALILCVIAMAWIYTLPPALVLASITHGWPIAGGLAASAWAAMAVMVVPVYRLYGLSAAWGFALPLTAALYTAMTVHSAWTYLRGHGGQWKGRTQASASCGRHGARSNH